MRKTLELLYFGLYNVLATHSTPDYELDVDPEDPINV
jgi:hypothetical protein